MNDNELRQQVYRFLALPFHRKWAIMHRLNLFDGDDTKDAIPDFLIWRQCFRRAKERGKLNAIWTEVDHEYNGLSSTLR